MRKAQKELAGNLIKLMERAHDQIRAGIEKKDIPNVLVLLAGCQEKAVQLGTMIEESEGEGFRTISMLEEYCETVYQIYDKLVNGGEIGANRVYKSLRQQMLRISQSVDNDIAVRREVVFLPYKASMWDSLESVWRAADADENCDAYVVPIPYYDRNPDGTFGEMHYEGDQYPSYVPVMNWREYDLAKRKPDAIFIHNPYDEWNYVTSVEPYFYSKKLRNYTDQLVYIPYFILKETDPSDQSAIDGIKHFCFVPGTIYAHKVIVQSEDMRQIYINEYIKEAKEVGLSGEHIDRKFVEKKFLGIGSPKMDKLLDTRKEDMQIPADWLRIIERPAGGFKKIVFYNTSVSALLQNSEKMLRKMKSVFEVFGQNTDIAALLWRPHPLIEATISSMRPQLWEEYRKVRDDYIKAGWGIYDDSADLDRALSISDVYYGDESSVANLYAKTGKLVIYQSVWCPKMNRLFQDIRTSSCAAVEGGYIWLVSNYTNVLLRFEWSTGKLIAFYFFPDKNRSDYGFVSCVMAGEKIYFAPYNGKEMWAFDMRQEQFEGIDLGFTSAEREVEKKFSKIIHHDQKLYLIGNKIPGIFCVNLQNGDVERYAVDVMEAEDNKAEAVFAWQYEIVGDTLYMPLSNDNAICTFHLISHETHICRLEQSEAEGFHTILFQDGQFQLTNSNDEVVWWDGKSEVRSGGKLDFLRSDKDRYKCVVPAGDAFLYFPVLEGIIGYLEGADRTVRPLDFVYPEQILFPNGFASKYEFVVRSEKDIFFQVRSNGDCYRIDLQSMKVEPLNLQIPIPVYEQIVRKMFEENIESGAQETVIKNIVNYLLYAKEEQPKAEPAVYCGEAIYNFINKGDSL